MSLANDAAASVCDDILARLASGVLSPPVALMELLIALESADAVRRVVNTSMNGELARLLDAHRDGAARVADMLRSDVDVPPRGASVAAGVAFCRDLFDWSVEQSEEASVALYSLGSAELLDAATAEIVDLFEAWGLTGKARRALDVGCGIGRMEVALARRFASMDATDISPKMLDAARRRCAGLANVRFGLATGFDLSAFGDAQMDLVFAVDTFPYLVQAGLDLAAAHVREAARVLVPGGDFVILNFSYRGDDARDREDVAALAVDAGLVVVVDGITPFAMWNGVAFRLRRPLAERPSTP